MIRMSWDAIISLGSLPRMRGDDPSGGALDPSQFLFAPHARG